MILARSGMVAIARNGILVKNLASVRYFVPGLTASPIKIIKVEEEVKVAKNDHQFVEDSYYLESDDQGIFRSVLKQMVG